LLPANVLHLSIFTLNSVYICFRQYLLSFLFPRVYVFVFVSVKKRKQMWYHSVSFVSAFIPTVKIEDTKMQHSKVLFSFQAHTRERMTSLASNCCCTCNDRLGLGWCNRRSGNPRSGTGCCTHLGRSRIRCTSCRGCAGTAPPPSPPAQAPYLHANRHHH
jgi:hypothetical protein